MSTMGMIVLSAVFVFVLLLASQAIPNMFASADQDAKAVNITNSSVNVSYVAGTNVTKITFTSSTLVFWGILLLVIVTIGFFMLKRM